MLLKDSPRKKCVTLPLANTDLYTSARIIISYYSSPQTKRYRYTPIRDKIAISCI